LYWAHHRRLIVDIGKICLRLSRTLCLSLPTIVSAPPAIGDGNGHRDVLLIDFVESSKVT